MRASLDDRISRAAELAKIHPAASDLLAFYVELARYQKPIFEELRSRQETEIPTLLGYFPGLFELVLRTGPEPLAAFGAEHLQSAEVQQELLLGLWEAPANDDSVYTEAGRFFGRVLLQPYAEYLASRGSSNVETSAATCPFCSARPAVGVLRGEGDGAKRSLICSLCATEWLYRRVVCPGCDEQDNDSLPVYLAAEFEHVRVEACDRCKTYIKSVDLTRDGRAIPLVDELATVPLNIWAEGHGYAKLETNLLGM
jgi:FdhE protein